jgi:biotin transporter BioY
MLRLLGPSGGYLMAYPLAALITGALADRGFDRRFLTSLAAMTGGLAIIFTGGVLWLAKDLGLSTAIAVGLVPFVVADLIKVVAAAAMLPAVWRMMGSRL